MPQIIAILFEENKEESYIGVRLGGEEPDIIFMKGPEFSKTMGPYPLQYAEATFRKWNYCMVENQPEIKLNDNKAITDVILHIYEQGENGAKYCP